MGQLYHSHVSTVVRGPDTSQARLMHSHISVVVRTSNQQFLSRRIIGTKIATVKNFTWPMGRAINRSK